MCDLLSLLSLRLRGTRSRNKRACLLRFESADLSYLSLRRTPVVGTLAPARRGGGPGVQGGQGGQGVLDLIARERKEVQSTDLIYTNKVVNTPDHPDQKVRRRSTPRSTIRKI